MKLRVVLSDAHLRRDVEWRFAQVVPIRDAVHERNDEVEARCEHAVEAPETLDNPRLLLRHDADRLDDANQDDDENGERDNRKTGRHEHSLPRKIPDCAADGPIARMATRYGRSAPSTSVEPRVATMYIVCRRGVSLDASTPFHFVPR